MKIDDRVVLSPGSDCRIGTDSDQFCGVVTAVVIYAAGRVAYWVAWWDGRTRHEELLSDLEVFYVEDRVNDRDSGDKD